MNSIFRKTNVNSTLSDQIKWQIGRRIIFSFMILSVFIFAMTLSDYAENISKLSQSINATCQDLEDFVVSEAFIDNDSAIQYKLYEINKDQENKVEWIKTGNMNFSKGFHVVFPFHWIYYYPLRAIGDQHFGYFKITGSLLHSPESTKEFMIRDLILLVFAILMFLILYPLARKIPKILFIEPISNIVQLLKTNSTDGTLTLIEDIPVELKEIETKITGLIKQTQEQSRKEAFWRLASQVAHDIRSPLTALDTALNELDSFPENQRIIVHNAVDRIKDIANNLLEKYKEPGVRTHTRNKEKELLQAPVIIALESIISEKRVEFITRQLHFTLEVEQNAHLLFVKANMSRFKRVLSNIINNSVEAIESAGEIRFLLSSDTDAVNLKIIDNGRGIAPELLPFLFEHGNSFGKKQGSGLGLVYAKKYITSWGGTISLYSNIPKGTTVHIRLPLASPPPWYQTEITLHPNTTIVVLDDDQSIHDVWEQRFGSLDVANYGCKLIHFYRTQELLEWYQAQEKNIIYLVDYELIGDTRNGLELIKELNIGDRSILVTSRFEQLEVFADCRICSVKLLPKRLSAYISIKIVPECQYVFIDDNQTLTSAWELRAASANKKLAVFNRIDNLNVELKNYSLDTVFYIDSDLNDSMRGEELAKELYHQGYKNLYLATGYAPSQFSEMPWIKEIVGKNCPF